MSDWADEIANNIFEGAPDDDNWSCCPAIALALRKAKADGVRLAETIYPGNILEFRPLAAKLADKIERGEE